MGEELGNEERKDNIMEMQRIKTFAKVKRRKGLFRAMSNLGELMKALQMKFEIANARIDELEKKNELIKKANEEINESMRTKIHKIEIESRKIKAER